MDKIINKIANRGKHDSFSNLFMLLLLGALSTCFWVIVGRSYTTTVAVSAISFTGFILALVAVPYILSDSITKYVDSVSGGSIDISSNTYNFGGHHLPLDDAISAYGLLIGGGIILTMMGIALLIIIPLPVTITIVGIVGTLYALDRLARFVFRVKNKFDRHVADPDAHNKVKDE